VSLRPQKAAAERGRIERGEARIMGVRPNNLPGSKFLGAPSEPSTIATVTNPESLLGLIFSSIGPVDRVTVKHADCDPNHSND
jgi:hypothetical protein